ncbi:MAG: YkgJ family cysteine cluster protein [Candidatus Brocadia sp.]|nr:YkgJ family cysteine cluster protein [Candidatus Brocadia sp.]MDG6027728.1 YkgJ family cysteine cluster protein [Candidatus Brocadia sp.]
MNNFITAKNSDIQGDMRPWYKKGLRFECQRCGRCCRGEPGVVWVNEKEIDKISLFLGIAKNVFAKNYLRSINGRFSLLEYGNGDCIMYDNGCKIYHARPCQCRTFPFWKPNLENQSEWEKLKKTCPGVDKGELHTMKEIEDNLKIYENRFG